MLKASDAAWLVAPQLCLASRRRSHYPEADQCAGMHWYMTGPRMLCGYAGLEGMLAEEVQLESAFLMSCIVIGS